MFKHVLRTCFMSCLLAAMCPKRTRVDGFFNTLKKIIDTESDHSSDKTSTTVSTSDSEKIEKWHNKISDSDSEEIKNRDDFRSTEAFSSQAEKKDKTDENLSVTKNIFSSEQEKAVTDVKEERKKEKSQKSSETTPVEIHEQNLNCNGNIVLRYPMKQKEPGFNITETEITKFRIWPRGNIPFYIEDYSFDKVLRDRLRAFLDMTNSLTGLNFEELTRPPECVSCPENRENKWVFFINRQGQLKCSDYSLWNFTTDGLQKVIIGYDCFTPGELAKLILALVGIPPQHNAPNRDQFVEVFKDNIIPNKTELFEILPDSQWLFHDVPYDFHSAGHYGFHAYTKRGAATIKPKKRVDNSVGDAKGFSPTDIWKIKMVYNYISKKPRVMLPDCKKLFNPNDKYQSNVLQKLKHVIKTRKLPDKYLLSSGIPLEDDDSNLYESTGNNKSDNADLNEDNDEEKSNENNSDSPINNIRDDQKEEQEPKSDSKGIEENPIQLMKWKSG